MNQRTSGGVTMPFFARTLHPKPLRGLIAFLILIQFTLIQSQNDSCVRRLVREKGEIAEQIIMNNGSVPEGFFQGFAEEFMGFHMKTERTLSEDVKPTQRYHFDSERWTVHRTDEKWIHLANACYQLYEALETQLQISKESKQYCINAVSDLSKERARNFQFDRGDFVTLAQRIGSPQGGSDEANISLKMSQFDALNVNFQEVFADFEYQKTGVTFDLAREKMVSLFCTRMLVSKVAHAMNPQMTTKLHVGLSSRSVVDVPTPGVRRVHPGAPAIVPVPTPASVARDRQLQATNPPTINDVEFSMCLFDLFTSDQECCPRDSAISEDEFIFVLNNRFDLGLPEGYPFTSLNNIYQQAYRSVTQGSPQGLDITGSIPGTAPTTSPTQMDNLRFFCSELERAHEAVVASTGPVPTAPTTPPFSGSPRPTSTLFFRNECNLAVLYNEDDVSGLDATEYVKVIQRLLDDTSIGTNQITGTPSFTLLPTPLKDPFSSYGTSTIPIQGSQGQRSSGLNLFCDKVDAAIRQYLNPQPTPSPVTEPPRQSPSSPVPVPTSSPTSSSNVCFNGMVGADVDQSETLDEAEYIAYVSSVDGTILDAETSFSNSPYIIRDNFQWITGVDAEVELAAAIESQNSVRLTVLRTILTASCERTDSVIRAVAGGNDVVSLRDHCFAALAVADENEDDVISEAEFIVFVNRFSGVEQGIDSISDLEAAFQIFFNSNSGGQTSPGIQVSGTKPFQTPTDEDLLRLDSFCSSFETTLAEVRSSSVLLERCRLAVEGSDANADNTLSQEEFVIFISTMAGEDSNGLEFGELSEDIQAFFPSLTDSLDTVDLNAWLTAQTLTDSQRNTTESTCEQALQLSKTITSKSVGSETTTIFSSFLFSNTQGIVASQLEPTDTNRLDLERAFDLFVTSEVTLLSELPSRNLRRRLDLVGIVTDSSELYQFDDTACAEMGNQTCQTAYGRLEMMYRNEENVDALRNRVTATLQQAILDGKLQISLDEVNPSSPFTILGPGAQVQPPSDSDDDLNKLLIGLISGAFLVALVCGVIVIGILALRTVEKQRQRRRHDEYLSSKQARFSFTDKPKQEQAPLGTYPQRKRPSTQGPRASQRPLQGQGQQPSRGPPVSRPGQKQSQKQKGRVKPSAPGRQSPSKKNVSKPRPQQKEKENLTPYPSAGIFSKQKEDKGAKDAAADNNDDFFNEDFMDLDELEDLIDDDVESEEFDDEVDIDDESYRNESGSGEAESAAQGDGDSSANSMSTAERRKNYKETIENLIRDVVPDEIEHVDAMMDQFVGREEELISTLRNMANNGSSSDEGSDEEDDSGESGDYSADDSDEEGSGDFFSDEESSDRESYEEDDNMMELESESEYDEG